MAFNLKNKKKNKLKKLFKMNQVIVIILIHF